MRRLWYQSSQRTILLVTHAQQQLTLVSLGSYHCLQGEHQQATLRGLCSRMKYNMLAGMWRTCGWSWRG